MVWGMKQPSSFGKYWPDGVFEASEDNDWKDGWFERLQEHYRAQSREEQLRLFPLGEKFAPYDYALFAQRKFHKEPGTGADSEHPAITPIEPHEAPFFYVTRPYPSLGSYISMSAGPPAVDEDLKALIERFEPGVHQFFPIPMIIGPNGQEFQKKYYIIVIINYHSSFCKEQSDRESYIEYGPKYPGFYNFVETKAGMQGLALRREIFGNSHLWKERSSSDFHIICLSNDLKAAIDDAGLHMPKHFKMKEV